MPAFDKADLQRRMHGAVDALKHDLVGLRTGRASINLLDSINVEVYGAQMPLNQVATVSVPEPRMLTVQVWDVPSATATLLAGHAGIVNAVADVRGDARVAAASARRSADRVATATSSHSVAEAINGAWK